MFKQIILLGLLGCSSLLVGAQDVSYSQPFNTRTLLNPAFAGLESGIRASMVHRNQWRAIAKRNFYTNGLALDFQSCRFPNMGLGLVAMNDVEGAGQLTVNSIGLIYSYKILFGKKSSLSMSLQSDYYNGRVDWSSLVFSDQLDPILGNVRPSSNATAPIENRNYFDFSSGLLIRHVWKRPGREIFWHTGLAAHHLPFGFNQAFLGDATLPLRITWHGGWLIPMFKTGQRLSYHIMPYFRFSGQDFAVGKHRTLDLGVRFMNRHVLAGIAHRSNPISVYLRNTDAISLSLGLSSDLANNVPFRVMYSYDFNYKGVSNGTVGIHEISLIIAFKNTCRSRFNRIHKKDCFDYGKKGLEGVF